ncbi:MAG TPA: hypothetical protein PLC04_00925 [Candidatus Kapabacteria bacterium]|jgi:hypothetical protein|nr:hypothetical protein [Candidatus Kapabacteria bacterium]HOV91631.1 hypothetical protein [Candidatus Kapabacteria bacterium]
MKNIIIAASFFLLFFAISCNDNSVQTNAVEMSLDSLSELPGYDWIGSVMASYTPDTTIFNEIKPLLDSNSQYFLFFVKSCGPCASASQQFVEIIKILQMCNFPNDRYEILVMNSISNSHPYQNIIHIYSLPTIMLLKNNVPIYSLSDTLAKSIEKQLKYPVKSEELLYEALKVANQ